MLFLAMTIALKLIHLIKNDKRKITQQVEECELLDGKVIIDESGGLDHQKMLGEIAKRFKEVVNGNRYEKLDNLRCYLINTLGIDEEKIDKEQDKTSIIQSDDFWFIANFGVFSL